MSVEPIPVPAEGAPQAALPLGAPAPRLVAPALTAGERLARLQLARSENVGPSTFRQLMTRFRSAEEALARLPELAQRGGRKGYTICAVDVAEAEMAAGEAAGARLMLFDDADYPERLGFLPSAPPALWLKGGAGLFRRSAVAIVGARNASALGLRQARRMAEGLGVMGEVIVSGLARGVDAAAHEAALPTGTIAVLPGGIDRIYPPEHDRLVERILDEGGIVLAECAPGTEATGRHFPRRNRIVAGLVDGIVVIEAAERSGSLITARAALENGREVMACPGAAEDPRAAGCNMLIRDGAVLVRGAADVREALGPLRRRGFAEEPEEFRFDTDVFAEDEALDGLDDFDPEGGSDGATLGEQVVAALGPSPVEIDELARACGTSPAELSLVLLELDIAGRITLMEGGLVATRPT